MKKPVVAYFRTSSTVNVGKDKDSKKRQQTACAQHAANNNLKISAEFYDDGVSGTNDIINRRGFEELLAYCDEYSITTILFENASRLSRDLITQETGYRLLSERGFQLISCDNPNTFIEESPTTVMVRQIVGAVSQFEKNNLVSKLAGARKRKRTVNMDKGIVTLTGQGKCEGNKRYDELEPGIVKEAKRLYRRNPKTGKRRSLRVIADELNKMGYLNRKGNIFAANQIRRMVS